MDEDANNGGNAVTEHRILETEDEIRAALASRYEVWAISDRDTWHVATMQVRGVIDGVAYVDAEWSKQQLGIPIGTSGIRFEAFRAIPTQMVYGSRARVWSNVWR